MIDHLPECQLLEPCSADTPLHGYCSRQNTICIHCERECICDRLRACEDRIKGPLLAIIKAGGKAYAEGWEWGRAEALEEARDAVEALPDAIFQQAAWVKHEEAINAIDALREEKE